MNSIVRLKDITNFFPTEKICNVEKTGVVIFFPSNEDTIISDSSIAIQEKEEGKIAIANYEDAKSENCIYEVIVGEDENLNILDLEDYSPIEYSTASLNEVLEGNFFYLPDIQYLSRQFRKIAKPEEILALIAKLKKWYSFEMIVSSLNSMTNEEIEKLLECEDIELIREFKSIRSGEDETEF